MRYSSIFIDRLLTSLVPPLIQRRTYAPTTSSLAQKCSWQIHGCKQADACPSRRQRPWLTPTSPFRYLSTPAAQDTVDTVSHANFSIYGSVMTRCAGAARFRNRKVRGRLLQTSHP